MRYFYGWCSSVSLWDSTATAKTMTTTRIFAFDSFKQTFVDMKDHPSTIFIPTALLCLPLLFAVAVGSVVGGTVLNISLLFAGQISLIIWLPVLIIRATHEFAAGVDPGVTGLFQKATNLRLFSYIGTVGLVGLLSLAGAIVAFLPTIVVTAGTIKATGFDLLKLFDGPQALLILVSFLFSMLAFAAVIVLIKLRYGLAPQTNVLERISPSQSLSRANSLLKGHRGDFFLMQLTWFAISAILGIVVGGPAQIIRFTSMDSFVATSFVPLGPARAVIVALSAFLTSVISIPLITGATTNFYLALRSEQVRLSSIASYSEGYTPQQYDASGENPQTGDLAESEGRDQG